MTDLVINKGNRDRTEAKVCAFISSLAQDKSWRITVVEYRKRRSEQQNRYLWGICYKTIMEEAGEELRGWTADDLHEFFLGEVYGWQETEGFGRKRLKPLRRSSKLDTMEFVDFVDYIQRFAAEHGIYIADPE